MSEVPEGCLRCPLRINGEAFNCRESSDYPISDDATSGPDCPFVQLDLANAEMLKKCACVFDNGVCVEPCKYHGDAMRQANAELSTAKSLLEGHERGILAMGAANDELRAENQKLRVAIVAFIKKYDEVDPNVVPIYVCAALHGVTYSGDTYVEELKTLRQALGGTDV